MHFLYRFIKYLLVLLALAWSIHSLWFYALPRAQLRIASQPVRAAVADTQGSRQWGLMFRFVLQDGEGMLFVFPDSRAICMWMRYTFVPLSVAFVREDGRIASIEDMRPQTADRHCAKEPVKYALEVPQGWFAANALGVGDTVAGLPDQRP